MKTPEVNHFHEDIMMHNPPDGKTQWNLAGEQLANLIHDKENGSNESKRLAKWELTHRYAPCVYGKDDKIEMSPHYRNQQWTVNVDYGFRYRTCVTYEDPESPNPEYDEYDDRISSWYTKEVKETAAKVASKGAEPKTARWWEIYLSTLNNKKIKVNRIQTGIQANGYAWNAIGYSEVKKSQINETRENIQKVLNSKV